MQSMLSGLRVVPRDEATSNSQHKEERNPKEVTKQSKKDKDHAISARKAAGLEWMVKAPSSIIRNVEADIASSEVQVKEDFQVNPKELNPYLKDGGDGYPSESAGLQNPGDSRHSQPSVVGDGGLSWRLKALKRAKEQAEREGQKLDKVVEERWGSLANMTVSVSAKRAAHAHSHLHAIRDRKRNYMASSTAKLEKEAKGSSGGEDKAQFFATEDDKDLERITTSNRDYLKDVSTRDTRMKAPHVTDSLSWKRRKSGPGHLMRSEDVAIFQAAASALNKFQNDGSFLQAFSGKQAHQGANTEKGNGPELLSRTTRETVDQQQEQRSDTANAGKSASVQSISIEGMSANQLAAKALQLRLHGKNEEADEVLSRLQIKKQEEEELPKQWQGDGETKPRHYEQGLSYKQSLKSIVGDYDRRLKKNDGGDIGLVENILHNKQYNRLTCIDDEYEFGSGGFEDSESKKTKKKTFKNVGDKEAKRAIQAQKRIVTQEERCQFCFSNPSRPKHLTVSIGNSCYLMLPPWEPLVEGHCLLAPMQHEGSSRNVDENVWEELRNYKKCLLQMFANQDKNVLFMETAIHLAQQHRHCLVECIPLPPNLAKQAPLYFKKAIDEAEDEWSQHNAKKLIDTSERGLRACIPKNFPYFHVEFGLRAGYVHVIDNEKDFKSDFGRNVVIGMLKLPEEEMHRRRKQQSYDQQKKAAIDFQKAWDPFDWTKMLD